MHELYITAIIVIAVCAVCFYYLGVQLNQLAIQIKLIRHDLNLDKQDYKRLLEIKEIK